MQLHVPFIGETRPEIRSEMMGEFREIMLSTPDEFDIGSSSWEAVSTETIEKEIFWEAYRDNLIRALEEVIPLVEQLPGKSVITSDHRNAIGEWATPFPIPVYFHPSNIRIPVLNDVPWFIPRTRNERRSFDRTTLSRGSCPTKPTGSLRTACRH